MAALMLSLAGLMGGGSSKVNAQASAEPAARFWRPNGPVLALLVTNQTVYLGGSFSYVGPSTGPAGVASLETGKLRPGFPLVEGLVTSAAPDGQGGWFIGGNFSRVGGLVRSNLAHVRADFSVNPAWNPLPNGTNNAIAVVGGTVYVGGSFTRIAGGLTRNRLAALDAAAGAALDWKPNAGGGVTAILPAGDTVYVGGAFTTLGGQNRGRIAAVEAATGQVRPWNPNATSGQVNALALADALAYVAGTSPTIGGRPRNRLAALSTTDNLALDWNPNADGPVTAVAPVAGGGVVFAGGSFTNIGGLMRPRLAALDAGTGQATEWSPAPNGEVRALRLAGDTLLAGGQFTHIGGEQGGLVAGFDAATGALKTNTPLASSLVPAAGTALVLEVSGGELFAGGAFASLGGEVRNSFAALDTRSGAATEVNPDVAGLVTTIGFGFDSIYLGGTFTNVSGEPRLRLARLLASNGRLLAWDPAATTRGVSNLVVTPDLVYVGGGFTNVGGIRRSNLAALHPVSGAAVAEWNPNPTGGTTPGVHTLLAHGGLLYVGGEFTSIGGQSRNRLAAISTADGTASAWNPNANALVSALALHDGLLYVGGSFGSIGGLARNRLAALDPATGQAVPTWNPDAGTAGNPRLFQLAAIGDRVYAAGLFPQLGGEFRNRVGSVRTATGSATPWNPDLNAVARAIVITSEAIFVGGDFTTVGGRPVQHFAVFSAQPSFDPATARIDNGRFRVSVRTGEPGRYVIQSATAGQPWQELASGDAGAVLDFTDPNPLQSDRIYRVILAPSP
ncbi:MAG TPA: hypothetical protein PKE47_07355 [Verrucomicrobiota bacterium]|nr:hypothetical protein [Verrucomicrobiota bacterium]